MRVYDDPRFRPAGKTIKVFVNFDKDGTPSGIRGQILMDRDGTMIYWSVRKNPPKPKDSGRFWKWDSWGIDMDIIDWMQRKWPNVYDQPQTYIIYDEDEQMYYTTSRKYFTAMGKDLEFRDGQRNCNGPQRHLPRREWVQESLLSKQNRQEQRDKNIKKSKKQRRVEEWIPKTDD
jgi:hypothetical protein